MQPTPAVLPPVQTAPPRMVQPEAVIPNTLVAMPMGLPVVGPAAFGVPGMQQQQMPQGGMVRNRAPMLSSTLSRPWCCCLNWPCVTALIS